MTVQTPSRPVMRYLGGKFGSRGCLADWIVRHLPPHRVYVEPFGGAASVLLRKPRAYSEVYNDLNEDVVNVFRVLRDPLQAEQLRAQLELTPFSRQEFDAARVEGDDPVERARRTIFRSFAGFGSASANIEYVTGFRANSNRSGTTPAHDWRSFPDVVPQFVERLRGVVVECRDALEVMRHQDSSETLHYVDPPYLRATRQQGITRPGKPRQEYTHEYTDAQHEQLADALHELQGMVVLSGYPSAMYDQLYQGWERIDRASFADGARPRTECLWLNSTAAAGIAAQGPDLFGGGVPCP